MSSYLGVGMDQISKLRPHGHPGAYEAVVLDGKELGDVRGLHLDLAHLKLKMLKPLAEDGVCRNLILVARFRRLVILNGLETNADVV